MEQTVVKPLSNPQNRQIERAKREWEVTVDTLPQLICLLDYYNWPQKLDHELRWIGI